MEPILPEQFVRRIGAELGAEEGAALCAALDAVPPVAVRIHPQKGEALGPLPALAFRAPVPWSPEGRLLTERPLFTLDTDFHAGAYYVQEAASQFVGQLLPGPGTAGLRILDLCAAPGGKTTLYASLAGPDGLVVANEIDRRRAAVLADNVRKWGTGNVVVTVGEARQFGELAGFFDVVAVDAPCSGEGMFRKDPAARTEWSEGNVRLCARRQEEILAEAWRALRPGGTLIYSTCTFNREEDEGSLERLLAAVGPEVEAADPVAVDGSWGIVCGAVGAFQTFRFFPHRTVGEGFFAAVARKREAAGRQGAKVRPAAKNRRSVIAPADRTAVREAAQWLLEPDGMQFVTVADTLYAWYGAQADAVRMLSERLPVICSGVALGQLFKGRLKPDPALAFFTGLRRAALPVTELAGEEALNYLRRAEIDASPFAEGTNLVCARGRALGFAKRIGARINNGYPASLRIVRQ